MATTSKLLGLIMACTLSAAALAQEAVTPPATATLQKKEIAHGDPHRWYVADNTAASQMRNLRKEINAALQEQLTACKRHPSDERASCERDAHLTYQQDMGRLKEIRTDNNNLQ
ncbi:MAG: hypothetical protein JO370_14515 [Paucibacter sp.]|nr:hypothetical protein [Roseateles sp.]